MTDFHVTANGERVRSLKLTVPNQGAWLADIVFAEAPALASGAAVDLKIGAQTWRGIVSEGENGSFALARHCMLRGGAGAWSRTLPAKHYHNDAGVRASLVAEDLCRELGETLGSFVPAHDRLGVDYVRQAGRTAAGTLEDIAGGVPWYVAGDGTTNVGLRPATSVDASRFELLSFDPKLRVATIALAQSELGPIGIGSILVDPRLDAAATIREYTLEVDDERLRLVAYCGGSDTTKGNLSALLTSIVQRIMDGKLLGKYRYRVVRMTPNDPNGRVDLQIVNQSSNLPDLRYISMWPGVSGAHAALTPGVEVLVEFVEGDRAQPVLVGFAGKGKPGHSPESITFRDSGIAAARVGSQVSVAPQVGQQIVLTAVSSAVGSGAYTFTFSPVVVAADGATTVEPVLTGTVRDSSSKVYL
jgi:hypothetical protein